MYCILLYRIESYCNVSYRVVEIRKSVVTHILSYPIISWQRMWNVFPPVCGNTDMLEKTLLWLAEIQLRDQLEGEREPFSSSSTPWVAFLVVDFYPKTSIESVPTVHR